MRASNSRFDIGGRLLAVNIRAAFWIRGALGVERSTMLTGFSSMVTNAGTGGMLQFDETDASESQRNYRARLQ